MLGTVSGLSIRFPTILFCEWTHVVDCGRTLFSRFITVDAPQLGRRERDMRSRKATTANVQAVCVVLIPFLPAVVVDDDFHAWMPP